MSAASKDPLPSPQPRRAKEIFGDCALVEIIHLHDCFRGALKTLEIEVSELCQEMSAASSSPSVTDNPGRRRQQQQQHSETRLSDLERRVAGRFTVIWSVFRAHSAAEDEFIWPALKAKQVSLPDDPCGCGNASSSSSVDQQVHSLDHNMNEQEYEEDHADEERMFTAINALLSNLRDELSNCAKTITNVEPNVIIPANDSSSSSSSSSSNLISPTLRKLAQMLSEATRNLMRHLMTHLDKEETHCMPLVMQYLTKAEINDLVGKIMGKRSSQLMSQILTMAIQNLNDTDRDDMVKYMKQAMVGTFFERWLKMGGWMEKTGGAPRVEDEGGDEDDDGGGKVPSEEKKDGDGNFASSTSIVKREDETDSQSPPSNESIVQSNPLIIPFASTSVSASASNFDTNEEEIPTSAAELQKLIRAIGTNPHLDAKQKTLTIQGLRDSVWKSNCRLSKRKREVVMMDTASAMTTRMIPLISSSSSTAAVAAASASTTTSVVLGGYASTTTHRKSYPAVSSGMSTRFKRETPPSSYYKKMSDGEVKLVWSNNPNPSSQFHPNDGLMPLFSASELAPTYHDGGIHQCLGCPHYARSCKLRHPTSGRLYTCRLCCEQTREMATNNKDSPLDRYEVKEVLCMICGALQPASDKCVNADCSSAGKPFARYSCNICNFYDDSSSKSTYHCPFCNVCRSGQGLGIDYYHCMRCNACVSIKDEHHCIPQRLQGNCPICHETMFESTEPLRGLRCGHVMHLGCFSMYMRGQTYTCPLCKKSAEDMSEYFTLLDSAVRMQPMPPAYSETTSNIYCQDCCQMGNVGYHFVGLKCQHCGSYNTRELQRVDALWNHAPPWP